MVPILYVEFEVTEGSLETGRTRDINLGMISTDIVAQALRVCLLSTGYLLSTQF